MFRSSLNSTESYEWTFRYQHTCKRKTRLLEQKIRKHIGSSNGSLFLRSINWKNKNRHFINYDTEFSSPLKERLSIKERRLRRSRRSPTKGGLETEGGGLEPDTRRERRLSICSRFFLSFSIKEMRLRSWA